jgi:hypothetical protein
MADKTVTIEVTGPDVVIDGALDAFVRQHGWADSVGVDEKGQPVPNPETKELKARTVIRQFMIDSIKAWNIRQAEVAARAAAVGASESALDTTKMTLELK